MNCDFCRKQSEKYKSFYSPSGIDPREYHVVLTVSRIGLGNQSTNDSMLTVYSYSLLVLECNP